MVIVISMTHYHFCSLNIAAVFCGDDFVLVLERMRQSIQQQQSFDFGSN